MATEKTPDPFGFNEASEALAASKAKDKPAPKPRRSRAKPKSEAEESVALAVHPLDRDTDDDAPADSPAVAEETGPPTPEAPSEPEKPSEEVVTPQPTAGVKFTPRELYDEVEKIRGQQAGISNKDVFALLSRRTGRSEGSISQTYYNVVRKASNRGQRRAGPQLKARGDSLSAQVAAMERELLELRAFKARVESIVGI